MIEILQSYPVLTLSITLLTGGIAGAIIFSLLNRQFQKKKMRMLEDSYQNKYIKQKEVVVGKINNAFHSGSEMLEEIASSLNTIKEVVNHTSEPIRIISDSGSQAQRMISDSQVYMQNMQTTLTQLINEVCEMTNKLCKHMEQVNSKTLVIHNIANQANLLSINAAIEAARVGEVGQGFSVVANDMTRLSDLSAGAAEEITKILSIGLKDIEKIKIEMETKMGSFGEVSANVFSRFDKMNESIESINELTNSLSIESGSTAEQVKTVGEKTQTTLETLTKMLSDVVGNLSGNVIKDISPADAKAILHDFTIIDVRNPNEFNDELGHIDQAKLYTLNNKFKETIAHLDPTSNYLFVCRSGGRSARAARIAQAMGFKNVSNLSGGMLKWRESFRHK